MSPQTFDTYHEDVAAYLRDKGPHSGLPGWLGIRHVEVGPGRLVAELDCRDELLNTWGTMHGGVISALTDHVLGAVLYPVIQKRAWAATTEFKLNLTKPITAGTVRATSEVVTLGRSTAVVRIDVHNEGRTVALAQGTVTIVPPRD
ncbi:MAG TPA: PaaI family thioesterase [Nitriliruptorales bacterium]